MNKVLILSGNQNYAASSVVTVDTAVTADLLAIGAIAMYGFVDADATTSANNKSNVLVTYAATGAGVTLYSDFVKGADSLRMVQGAATYPVETGHIQLKGVTKVVYTAYSAAVKQVSFVGWNGKTGAGNLPTILEGTTSTLQAVQVIPTTPNLIRDVEHYSISSNASDSMRTVMITMINAINNNSYKTHSAFLTNNATTINTYTTGSSPGKATLTKGSTIITWESASPTGAASGDDIIIANTSGNVVGTTVTNINGVVYKIADITSAVWTLTTPYMGETETIASQTASLAGIRKLTTAGTEFGIKLLTDTAGHAYKYALDGNLQYATLTYGESAVTGSLAVQSNKGTGVGSDVVLIEDGTIAYRGQFDTVSKWQQQLPKFANAATNYATFYIQYTNSTVVSGTSQSRSINNQLVIYIPSAASTAITNLQIMFKGLFPNASCNW